MLIYMVLFLIISTILAYAALLVICMLIRKLVQHNRNKKRRNKDREIYFNSIQRETEYNRRK